MNINPDKIEDLIKGFVNLDEKYQRKLMSTLLMLRYEQQAEKDIKQELLKNNNNNNVVENSLVDQIKKRRNKTLNEALDICEKVKYFDDEQRAQFICLMENLKPGTFTKKNDITIKIDTKQVSLKEYLENHYPNVNYKTTKNMIDSYLKEL